MARPRVVVLRALGLGDLLTAVPALRALRDACRDHRIALACPAGLAPLARLSGAVDEVVDARPLAPLPPEAERADLAVNLHGSGPESHRILLATRPRDMIAFRHEDVPETRAMPVWRDDEHEVARWCRLLRERGIPADPRRLDLEPPVVAATRGATLVHPGAASPARRWPADRYAAVARAELDAGRRVVVTAGPGETALADELRRLAPGVEPAGPTTVLGLAGVVAAAGRVVCGDTGVAHLATAFGVPSVVLFGPTPPGWWGPPADRPRHRVLWAGRVGDPHGDEPHPGLLEIGVDAVLAELAALDGLERAA